MKAMTNFLAKTLVFIFLSTGCYGIIAFTHLNYDPTQWTALGRLLFAGAISVLLVKIVES